MRSLDLLRALSLVALTACASDLATAPQLPAVASLSAAPPTSLIQIGYWTASILPLPPGFIEGAVLALNDSDVAVGYVEGTNGLNKPVKWKNGVATLLTLPAGYSQVTLNDVNLSGMMVGTGTDAGGKNRAVRYTSAGPVVLSDPGLGAQALGVNDNGEVVGYVWTSIDTQPVRWNVYGQRYTLPVGGFTTGQAFEINNAGVIIGRIDYPGGMNAYRWVNGVGSVLNPPLASPVPADINDAGAIVFRGTINGLWTAMYSTSPYLSGTAMWADQYVSGVSNKGRAVGREGSVAITWRNGSAIHLPVTNAQSTHAAVVNTCGNIGGYAYMNNGTSPPVFWKRSFCDN